MYVHTKKDCINTTRIRTTVSAKPVGKKAKSQRVRRFMRAFPRFRALRTAAQKELERKQKDESKRDIWHDCILLLPVSHFRLLNPTLHPYRIGHLWNPQGFGSYPTRLHASTRSLCIRYWRHHMVHYRLLCITTYFFRPVGCVCTN